jgi:hypothetical protein
VFISEALYNVKYTIQALDRSDRSKNWTRDVTISRVPTETNMYASYFGLMCTLVSNCVDLMISLPMWKTRACREEVVF